VIARALAGKLKYLLDDSSSALDYRTDSQLRRAIRENYENTTTIVNSPAHKLSVEAGSYPVL
jgi:ATP-binding cassette subfamily B protein